MPYLNQQESIKLGDVEYIPAQKFPKYFKEWVVLVHRLPHGSCYNDFLIPSLQSQQCFQLSWPSRRL